jgi:hypothetical protein
MVQARRPLVTSRNESGRIVTQDLPLTDEKPPTEVPVDRAPVGKQSSARPGSGPTAPLYKGQPLDPARGPGLGCFWLQVGMLGILLVLTPLTVIWAYPFWVSAALLILTLVLLLVAGQTVIFLLRLVAADRRTRRRPMGSEARKTVGMLEDEEEAAAGPAPGHGGAENHDT